ncbi:MAG: hypothetical protein V4819_04725 [Verrucomicrobiota bacterium]
MDPFPDFETVSSPVPATTNRSFWQKFGGGSLSISLFLHVILLAIGVIWVLQIIPPEPAKVVDFMPNSGGGGSSASEMKVKQRVQMVQPDLSRVVAAGATGISIPEPEELTRMTSLGGLSSGALAGGQGGSGSGGGKGDGNGLGFGNGLAPGISTGNGTKNPFGMINPSTGALVGTFYDLKQTTGREPTKMTDDEMRTELKEIVRRGFKEKVFEKYFKAPRVLYQTKLHIPIMSAEGAPAAFECEKEVQPRRWIVVYRGAVQAPRTGKFRFVGAGDDMLVVRFNNRPVFDYGYTLSSTGTHMNGRGDDLTGKKDNPELAKEVRKLSPMKVPITFYQYTQTPNTNKNIGGFAVGPEFEAKEGQTYPIEILIGEIPGGYFNVSLLIEEVGATYQKDPGGSPILPLFRVDPSLPNPDTKGEAPPYDPNGPVWKAVGGGAQADI